MPQGNLMLGRVHVALITAFLMDITVEGTDAQPQESEQEAVHGELLNTILSSVRLGATSVLSAKSGDGMWERNAWTGEGGTTTDEFAATAPPSLSDPTLAKYAAVVKLDYATEKLRSEIFQAFKSLQKTSADPIVVDRIQLEAHKVELEQLERELYVLDVANDCISQQLKELISKKIRSMGTTIRSFTSDSSEQLDAPYSFDTGKFQPYVLTQLDNQ